MKNRLMMGVVFLVPFIIFSFGLYRPKVASQHEKTLLEQVGDQCAGISENSVANMPAIVEFQKLEIEGRKVNVMRRCMADHGYFENPEWTIYAKPIAHRDSIAQGISEDEAIENLRRKQMVRLKPHDHDLIYWVPHP